MSVKKDIDDLVAILKAHINIKIWHMVTNRVTNEVKHATSVFKFSDLSQENMQVSVYEECAEGHGFGSNLSLRDAAKKILMLLRDNHDLLVEEIKTNINNIIEQGRTNFTAELAWPCSPELEENTIFSGTVFCDNLERMQEINNDLEDKRQKARIVCAKIYEELQGKLIPEWRECRRAFHYWYTDEEITNA